MPSVPDPFFDVKGLVSRQRESRDETRANSHMVSRTYPHTQVMHQARIIIATGTLAPIGLIRSDINTLQCIHVYIYIYIYI